MSNGSPAAEVELRRPADPEKLAHDERIAVCHIASGDRWAGAEAQMAFLLKGLAKQKAFRLSAILLNEGALAEELRGSGIEIHIESEHQKTFLEILAGSTRLLRNKGIRILHSHRYKENLLAALLAWRCGIPFVVRSQQGLAEPFKGAKRYKQAILQQVDRVVAGYYTDCVIAASDDLRKTVSRYVSPDKVVTVHNALDLNHTHSNLSLADSKEKLGVPPGHFVVGIAGRLEPIKRVDIFLRAAAQIAAKVPDTRFVVTGSGSQEAGLRTVADAIGIKDRVLFLGHRNDIHDVVRAFDVLVLCSDHEGLPTIVLEALYLGSAVVARSVGGVPEVIQNGINGLLVESDQPSDLADACIRLLTDDEYRRRLGASGISSVAENFSSEKTAARVADVYRSLCESR